MITRAYLGLGSNLGEQEETLRRALGLLNAHPDTEILRSSSIYVTTPVGFLEQPDFYNMVTEIATRQSPVELLDTVLQIEKKLHRIRTIRNGPRTLDIDILLYGEQVICHPQLQIPHPRMHERGFVLIPLLELTGVMWIPGVEESVTELIDKLPAAQRVDKITKWTLDEDPIID